MMVCHIHQRSPLRTTTCGLQKGSQQGKLEGATRYEKIAEAKLWVGQKRLAENIRLAILWIAPSWLDHGGCMATCATEAERQD